MQSILSFFIPQTIQKVNSSYNGEIKVTLFCNRISIEAGGLMQSGKFLEETWEKALQKFEIRNSKLEIPRILILGLGGGSVVHALNKKFPKARIVAVDIDRNIVELGRKYNNLSSVNNLKIVITDAQRFVKSEIHKKNKFDMIFVDLYRGYEIPPQFQTVSFMQQLSQILLEDGIVIFNRLKTQMNNTEAKQFLDKLHNIFQYVNRTTILANTFVVASS